MSRYRGILLVLLAVGIVWAASLLQFFLAPTGWLYDGLVRLGGWRPAISPSVLMVEVGSGAELSAEDWQLALNHLQGIGAGRLVFLDPPTASLTALHTQAETNGNVIVGRVLEPEPDSGRQFILDSAAEPVSANIPVGMVSVPVPEFGVHRRAANQVLVAERWQPSLPAVVAQTADRQTPPEDFLVNFNHGQDWIPRVSVERLLQQGLIEELVGGRTVLIGRGQPPGQPTIHTPVSVGHDGMSLLEYQAFATDTLLQGRIIRTTSWGINLVVLGMIGLISLIVYQWLNLDRSSWFTIALIGAYLGSAWLLLHGLEIWLPAVEMIVAQLLMLWLFIRLKLMRDDQEMRRIVLQQMARLQEYILPPDFYELDEHWAQVISFIDQTLNLNRVIFLEKVKGDHRVREVQALRCSLQDIDERRRDYERVPYSDAIAEGGPVRLERRLFFKGPADGGAEQYLVPLVFGGEVQGFWAFDVDPAVVRSSVRFLGNIRDFGAQVAALLYHRHRRIEQRRTEAGVFRRLFRLDATNGSYQEVAELLSLLHHRLTALDGVFDGLATAAIHYDLFGRVVQLNRSMEQFMEQLELPGYKLTALDLLVKVAGIPQDQARTLLQQAVVDQRDFHLPLRAGGTLTGHYAVHVRPLEAREVDGVLQGTATPFQLAGVLFEFIDTRRLADRSEYKEQLLEWFRLQLQQDLDGQHAANTTGNKVVAVGGSAIGEIGSGSPAPGWSDCAGMPYASTLLGTLDLMQQALNVDPAVQSKQAYPVDTWPILMAVLEERLPTANEKGVELRTDIPRLLGLVRVQPQQLRSLFQTLLAILIDDAATDTQILVQVAEQGGTHHYSFRNTGFGIPDEHLQAYLWDPDAATQNEEFHALRQALRPLADWRGEFRIHSEVGAGIWAELQLKVVS